MNRKALGLGLKALISSGEVVEKGAVNEIPIDKIRSNPYQPRKRFDTEELNDLVNSIREKGIIVPVMVKQLGNNEYELIAGERRLRACQELGFKYIPAIFKDAANAEILEIALIENIQRKDLDPIEEAQAYQMLIDEFKLTQEQLAERLGKQRTTVTNTLRLLNLPKEIQEDVSRGTISSGHARTLLGLHSATEQKALWRRIIRNDLSVRKTESLADLRKKTGAAARKTAKISPELQNAENDLKRVLGTKVNIKGTSHRGKIEIEYYTLSDLERIIKQISR